MSSTLAELESEFKKSLQPGTTLEGIFASEIAYAAWELQRVRNLAANNDIAPVLNAAYARASRNWTRARKELKRLQTARLNHSLHVDVNHRVDTVAFPLADPARIPAVKPASPEMLSFAIDVDLARKAQESAEVQ